MSDIKPIGEIDGDPVYEIGDCNDYDPQGEGIMCPKCGGPATFEYPYEAHKYKGCTAEQAGCSECDFAFWVVWPYEDEE